MSIISDILGYIDTNIVLMTTSNYNYNYTSIDEYNPGLKAYPDIEKIVFAENSDLQSDDLVEKYTNEFEINFLCTCNDAVSNIDLYLSNIADDLKEFFYNNTSSLRALGLVDYVYLGNDGPIYTHVRKRPGKINVKFLIQYRQSMSSPSST